MSNTAEENAQPEQSATSSTQDENKDEIVTEEGAPVTKAEDADVKNGSQDADKEVHAADNQKNGRRASRYKDGILTTSPHDVSKDRYNNSKYDPTILPETDDPQLIRNQVEFYFGDSNLPVDNFLWNETDGSNNLPVSIAKICTFGRMKRFTDIGAVVAALRESHFLEVSGAEGSEKVNRKYAYEPKNRSKTEARSIYAKGFGDEEPSSQFDIEAFFTPYGPINSVRLRRTNDKLFKGSVFVEFQDEETADKFLNLDTKPLWKGEHPLKIMSKTQYNEEKRDDINDGKVEPGPTWTRGRGRGRGGRGGRGDNRRGNRNDRGGDRGHRNDRDRGGHDRGDRDPDDWKKRREDDRANGFRDDRNKSGRGRGRRDDRGPRKNDRNREREDKNGDDFEKKVENIENDKKGDASTEQPTTKEVDSNSKPVTEASQVENNKKRARESDGEDGSSAKKVDFKSDVITESS